MTARIATCCLIVSAIATRGAAQSSPSDAVDRRTTQRIGLSQLYNRIRQRPKSDFETSAAFSARTSTEIATRFTVVAPKLCSGNLVWGAKYVADSEYIRVSLVARDIPGTPVEGSESEYDLPGQVVFGQCFTTQSDSYHGANSFGVSREVSRASFVMYGLLMNAGQWPQMDDIYYLPVTIHASPAEARRLMPQLELLVDFNVWTITGFGPTARAQSFQTPTVDDPTDQTIDIRMVRAVEIVMRVRNSVTKKVLAVVTAP